MVRTDPDARPPALFDLTGSTALVIGAGRGIGRAAAVGLAQHGALVCAADLDIDSADGAARDIRHQGGAASAAHVDVTDPESVDRLCDAVPTPDCLVFTPGLNVRKRLTDMTDPEFERVLALNLTAAFRVVRPIGKRMAERGSGSIIVFSSIRAQVVEPGQGAYAAAKAGAVQLVRTLAAELGTRGVRANAIAPGIVETPLTEPIRADPDWYGAYAQKPALRRWAMPEEMVGPVVFLASQASSYVTGACLFVDGGWTAVDGRFDPPL